MKFLLNQKSRIVAGKVALSQSFVGKNQTFSGWVDFRKGWYKSELQFLSAE